MAGEKAAGYGQPAPTPTPHLPTEHRQATAFSGIHSACTVISKADSVTSRVIRVQCRDAGGRLADSRFNILLLR
jgi:hypothetical protein